jgi:hypothetical protein
MTLRAAYSPLMGYQVSRSFKGMLHILYTVNQSPGRATRFSSGVSFIHITHALIMIHAISHHCCYRHHTALLSPLLLLLYGIHSGSSTSGPRPSDNPPHLILLFFRSSVIIFEPVYHILPHGFWEDVSYTVKSVFIVLLFCV